MDHRWWHRVEADLVRRAPGTPVGDVGATEPFEAVLADVAGVEVGALPAERARALLDDV